MVSVLVRRVATWTGVSMLIRAILWTSMTIVVGPTALVGADESPTTDVRGIVALNQAIDAAVRQNPDLKAAAKEVGIRDALALQAGLRPNPSAGVQAEDIAGSGERRGWDAGQTTLSLSQLFELGGKRTKRRRAAELERDVVQWEIEVRRRVLIAEVGKAFAATLAAQQRLALIDDLVAIAERSVRSVEATVKAGAVSPVEQARAEVSLSRARASRLAGEQELALARTALASTWGSPTATFDRVAGRLDPIAKPPALDALLPHIQTIPDLALFETELAQRRAALAFERSRRIPDVTLMAGGRHYAQDGGGALVLGFALPLPIFDNNRGNILAASRAVTQARLEQSAGAITVETRARRAYTALEAAFRRATVLREQTIPEAERAYEGARDAYARGLFRYLEVLDAQRTLFELRSEYLTILANYYDASAELSRWVDDSHEDRIHNADGGIK